MWWVTVVVGCDDQDHWCDLGFRYRKKTKMEVMKPPRSRPPLPFFPLEPVQTSSSSSTLALDETKQLHAHLLRIHYHPLPATSINALVTSYTNNANPSAALLVYAHARSSHQKLDNFTVPSVLKACGRVPSIRHGREAHGYAVKTGLVSDLFVQNSLMQMYSECGDVGLARRVFEGMPDRDVVSWSTMIRCCTRNGCVSEGLELVGRFLRLTVRPSEVAMLNMVGLFADVADYKLGRAMHTYVMKNDGGGPKLDTALIDMYVKCGSTDMARRIFDGMPVRNTACWTSMIVGCIRAGDLDEGLRLFRAMHEQYYSMPNEITMLSLVIECGEKGALLVGEWLHVYMLKNGFAMSTVLATALVDMYAKCGGLERARRLFDQFHDRDVTAWTAMISGYAKANHLNQAIRLFGLMRREKVRPNGKTVVALLCACGEVGALDVGKWLHTVIGKEGIDLDVVLRTALVDMYSKCGDVEGAYKIFSATSTRDTCMWNAMMNGFALHGNGKEALKLFSRMEKERTKPNHVTFVGLLHACSHSGLVTEGKHLFNRMECDFGLAPKVEHYGCMVDVLARAGLLHEAHAMVKNMPIKPNVVVWGSLLAGCRIHKNAGLGEVAARKILEMEPENCGYNVLLSNIYALDNRWGDVADVRRSIKDTGGGKKEPGLSCVEVNGIVHGFAMGDASHPQSKQIYEMIGEMRRELRFAGHTPILAASLLNVEEEEEKETALAHHSEKLAIAFALISTSPGVPIRVVKNLRICDDCHAAAKILSEIYGRLIVIRDRNRFHHFKEGSCSCADYW